MILSLPKPLSFYPLLTPFNSPLTKGGCRGVGEVVFSRLKGLCPVFTTIVVK
jgi:hypothetical protein